MPARAASTIFRACPRRRHHAVAASAAIAAFAGPASPTPTALVAWLTQTLEHGVLAARKDVRFHDVGAWEFRNEVRFERKRANPERLIGTWQVDLRPTPDAPAHFAEFVVDAVEDGRIRGTFYGSPIRDGSVNVHWGELQFAFISDDASGAYYTSGVVRGGRLEGRTHCPHRQVLNVWHAERGDM